MNAREVTGTEEYLARFDYGADWREELEDFAAREEIEAAWFTALGSVQDAELWYYDQMDQEHRSVTFDERLEVAACTGNISLLEGEPFAHSHAVLSRQSGQALAGHLNAGRVFTGEAYIRTFEEPLTREPDDTTGLDSWL